MEATGQFIGGVLLDGLPEQRFMLNIDADMPSRGLLSMFGDASDPQPYAYLLEIQNTGEAGRFRAKMLGKYKLNDRGSPEPFDPGTTPPLFIEAAITADGTNWTGTWIRGEENPKPLKFWTTRTDRQFFQPVICDTWDDFKKWAHGVVTERDVRAFRGHGDSRYRLITTFHRTGRCDVWRYSERVVGEFLRHVDATLDVELSRERPDDFAKLMGLAQHHGLPTPFLDWSESPYIAAFFAVSDALEQKSKSDATHFRIYALVGAFAEKHTPPFVNLTALAPVVHLLQVSAKSNPRLYAQQGLFTYSNVYDIEAWLSAIGREHQAEYLLAADIPISQINVAIADLTYMGITASSLFPGLDGVCRRIKHQMAIGKL